jgi:DMSO/TMAO reductase YedYZ molybdopterin-dependent catalytic subunit
LDDTFAGKCSISVDQNNHAAFALCIARAILLRSHALDPSEVAATVKAIGRAGTGVNNVPVELMSQRGVPVFNAPGAGLAGVSPAITPVESFYVVSKNFADPNVDGQSWQLRVTGMVTKSLNLNLEGLRALPSTEEYVTLECISNNVGGDLMSTGQFRGVSLRDLVAMASPQSHATWVGFKARDGYTESLAIRRAIDDYARVVRLASLAVVDVENAVRLRRRFHQQRNFAGAQRLRCRAVVE